MTGQSKDDRGKKKKKAAVVLRDGESFPVYRPDELAAMLGVQVSTLREWRKLGRGPMFIRETAKSVVYLKETVHQWLRTNQQHTQVHYYSAQPPPPKKRTKPPPESDASSEPSGASGNAPQ